MANSFKVGARNSSMDMKRIQMIHDNSNELGAECKMEEGKSVESELIQAQKYATKYAPMGMSPKQYAAQECDDLESAVFLISGLSRLARSESYQDEPEEVTKLCDLMRGVIDYMTREIDEIAQATSGQQLERVTISAKNAQRNDYASKVLSLSYVKSLHLPHNEQFFKDVLAAKYIGSNEIEHAVALWGDPTLTDLEQEFFTSKKSAIGATDFWDAALGFPRPLTFNHDQSKDIYKGNVVIGNTSGFRDGDVARFATSVIDESNMYRKAFDELISKRVLGTSSDSAPQYVERVKMANGSVWLKTWPLFASALTHVPCEPRMLDVGNPYWKSAGINFDLIRKNATELGFEIPSGDSKSQIEAYQRKSGALKLHTV